jgi:hypothetical protein
MYPAAGRRDCSLKASVIMICLRPRQKSFFLDQRGACDQHSGSCHENRVKRVTASLHNKPFVDSLIQGIQPHQELLK